MAHIEEKYHNNPYFQTLFARFALDYNEQNLYFLTADWTPASNMQSLPLYA